MNSKNKVYMPPQGPELTEQMLIVVRYLYQSYNDYVDGNRGSPWVSHKELSAKAGFNIRSSAPLREAVSLLVRYHEANIVTSPQFGYCKAYSDGMVQKDIDRLQSRVSIMQERLLALERMKVRVGRVN